MLGRLVLVLGLVVGSVAWPAAVSSAAQVGAVAMVPCVITPATGGGGTFTGDECWFEDDPSSSFACRVDWDRGWYSPGCIPHEEAYPVSPPPPGAPPWPGCDWDGSAWVGEDCGPAPAEGYACDFETATGADVVVVCRPPGPPPTVADCVDGGGPGVGFTCDTGTEELPFPQCEYGGGANLLCNGDFEASGTSVTGEGAWYAPASPLSCSASNNNGFVYSSGLLRMLSGNTYIGGGSSQQTCTQDIVSAQETWQVFTVPSPGGSATYHFSFDIRDRFKVWSPTPSSSTALESQFQFQVREFGTTNDLWASGVSWSSCSSLISGATITWNISDSPLSCHGSKTLSYAAGTVVQFRVLQGNGARLERVGDNFRLWVDGWSADRDIGMGWHGDPQGTVYPPDVDPDWDCEWQGDLYVCYDPPEGIPAAPSPSPSPSLGPSPIPSPSPWTGGPDEGKPCYEAAVAAVARISLGVPYCWGSDDPDVPQTASELCPAGHGLDCSGLVMWSYTQAGVTTGDYTAAGLYDLGDDTGCTLDDLAGPVETCWAVGDLIYLCCEDDEVTVRHVALYVGGGLFADCYTVATGCQVWDVTGIQYYWDHFYGANRPSDWWEFDACGDGGPAGPGGGPGPGTGPGTGPTVGTIATRLNSLVNKEPVGTILDVAGYMTTLSASLGDVDTSSVSVSPSSSGGVYSGLFSGFTFAGIIDSAGDFLDWLADILDAGTVGGVSALDLLNLAFNVTCVFLLFRYVRARIRLTA